MRGTLRQCLQAEASTVKLIPVQLPASLTPRVQVQKSLQTTQTSLKAPRRFSEKSRHLIKMSLSFVLKPVEDW